MKDTKYVTEPTLDEFDIALEGSLPHPSHAVTISKKLFGTLTSITSPDTLISILLETIAPLCHSSESITTISSLVDADIKLSEESIFGRFVNSFSHALILSKFSTLIRLCKRIELYKNRGGVTRSVLGPSKGHTLDSSYADLRSAEENHVYLQREAEMIESLIGVLPRHAITTRIDRLMVRLPRTPQVFFLSYLVCLHHGDYLGALDKLHQYFDHILVNQTSTNTSSLLPYATLNLAAVHLRFGHIDEALELVREVTAAVQRKRDNICLARTLSLLFRLAEHRCDQSYQLQLLQQTLGRSLSLCLSDLTTQSMLDTAKHYLLHPRENTGLAAIPLTQDDTAFGSSSSSSSSSSSQLQHTMAAKARPDAVWRFIHASLSAAAHTYDSPTASALLTSQALLSTANIWSIYGNTTMANLASNLQLDIHRTHNLHSVSGPSDVAKSSILMVSTKLPTVDACSSLCTLAKSACEVGDERKAFALLLEAFNSYPQSCAQPQWIRSTRQILQEMAIRRGDMETAEVQAIQLSALSPLNLDLHHHIDALYRLAVVLMHKKSWIKANILIQSLIETCEGCGLTMMSIPFLLTQSEILLLSGSHFSAIAPLLSCLTMAKQFRLESVVATASIQLAHILLLEGSRIRAKMAQSLIDSVMPHILQHGSALLQSQALLESVKASLLLNVPPLDANGQASLAESSTHSSHYEAWTSALEQIEDIIQIASKMHSTQLLIEAYYFKARIANALGLLVQRNLAAKMFKSLQSSSQVDLKQAQIGSMHYYLDGSGLATALSRLGN
jgi:tetratricopeptide (TPR) repeat protein